MEKVYLVELKTSAGDSRVLFICKTLDGATKKTREFIADDSRGSVWVERHKGTLWNKEDCWTGEDQCIKVSEEILEP